MGKIIRILRRIAYQTHTIQVYHWMLALMAATWYRFPSRRMIVIGVTGTNGKTTTASMIAHILRTAGWKIGLTTTAEFIVGDTSWLNDKKMTMLGRWQLQKLLRRMVDVGCHAVIIETSSEGIRQYRHVGIDYDMVVWTNLTPEHIESHGSFEAYRRMKGKLLKSLGVSRRKTIKNPSAGGLFLMPHSIVANADDRFVSYFGSFSADETVLFSLKGKGVVSVCVSPDAFERLEAGEDVPCKKMPVSFRADSVKLDLDGGSCAVNGSSFRVNIPGEHNLVNALAAVAATRTIGVSWSDVQKGISKFTYMPGRMEFIAKEPIAVLVDYAPEPVSLQAMYDSLGLFSYKRLIHVLGSAGGGRDKSRRPILGKMAGENADIVIVTNEDPYDENPVTIINAVAQGAEEAGKKKDVDLFVIEDRRAALEKAYALALPGDLIVSTGKGSEQAICVANGKKNPWDERVVWREILRLKK